MSKTNLEKKNSKKFLKVNKNKPLQKENSLNELNSLQETPNFTMPLSEETKIVNNFFFSDINEIKKRIIREICVQRNLYISHIKILKI